MSAIAEIDTVFTKPQQNNSDRLQPTTSMHYNFGRQTYHFLLQSIVS
ncbi:hypothetical protein [Nostoc sp.]